MNGLYVLKILKNDKSIDYSGDNIWLKWGNK